MSDNDAPDSPDTDWLDDHIELYAVDVLTRDETARVEQDLDALPGVQRAIYDGRITETQQAIAGMASSYALTAPEDLRSRVLDRVFAGPAPDNATPAEEPVTSLPENVTPLRSPNRGRIAAALAAAAVVVAVALGAGVLIGRTTAPEPAPPVASTEAQQQISEVLSAPDATVSFTDLADDRGRISVVYSKSQNRAVTLLRDTTNPIASDQTFQLWLVGNTENPVSAGLIPGTGPQAPVVVNELGSSKVLAVTIEPGGGSPQPTTPILAQIPL